MRPIACFAACIAAAAAVPARAQTATPPAPADTARAAAPAAPAPRPRRNPNVITAAELEGQVATDVYELVRRLRPQWLRTRPAGTNEAAYKPGSPLMYELSVFVGGARAGEVMELRRIQVTNVRELRFYPSAEAITRWGRDYSAGVIEVTER